MPVYNVNLYLTTTGISDKDIGNVFLGKVLIETDSKKIDCKEYVSKDTLPVFVKADSEDTYFPQPQELKYITEAIEQYGFCLYVKQEDFTSKNKRKRSDIDVKSLSEENYPYYKLQKKKEELYKISEQEQQASKAKAAIREEVVQKQKGSLKW